MKTASMWGDTHLIINKKIRKLKAGEQCQIFCAEEYGYGIKLPKLKVNADLTWIWGGANLDFYKEYPGKVVLWPDHFLYRTFVNRSFKRLKKAKILKPFISMNNNTHQHRCMLLDKLAKHNMIENGYVSFRQYPNYGTNWEFKYWEPTRLTLDKSPRFQDTAPKVYNYALVDLVSESTMETLFVTEKTYKPIIFEKPFIVQSVPGAHQYLIDQGFEMYDEIFDYSFDNVIDDEKRTEMIVENVKRLEELDLNEVNKMLKEKTKHNKQVALNIMRNRVNVPEEAYNCKYYAELLEEVKCKLDTLG